MTTYQPYEQSLSVLGESQARVTVLEKELDKANRTIQKSKKAAEVQLLVRDNEVLQSKIRDQEEDFRTGMITLRRSGLNKIIEGMTTLDEVVRVTAAD